MKALRHLQGLVDPLCWHFAEWVCQQAKEPTRGLFLGALAASLATEEQHACAFLPHYEGKRVATPAAEDAAAVQVLGQTAHKKEFYPSLEAWKQGLRRHQHVVGSPGDYTPLILAGDRLYLYRYWDYEHRLARAVAERLEPFENSSAEDNSLLKGLISRLFPAPTTSTSEEAALQWQAVAAVTALRHRFHVITGGPGTGKTTTVSRMVALLLHQHPHLRIVLAAPTGKAATRMKESLTHSQETLRQVFPTPLPGFPTEAMTLHRLLGYQAQQRSYLHNAQNPLPWDLVIVDEASMIDLAMMTRLFEALSPDSRLVLLGDQNQLASVEAGSVLGDLCQAANAKGFAPPQLQQLRELNILQTHHEGDVHPAQHALDSHVVTLQESHRFPSDRGIGRLADCIQKGEHDKLALCLHAEEIRHQTQWSTDELQALLLANYTPYFEATTPEDAWSGFAHMMVLCALKQGPWGIQTLNQSIELLLSQAGQIHPTSRQAFYHLRPVMITQNDYRNQLFNGDIGITWQPTAHSPLRVYFQQADGSLQGFHPAQLGPHQTTWAMTIHKSQGSEFEHVLMVLPDAPHHLVSRELIYTGVTRAKQTVNLWCPLETLKTGIQTPVQRYSGLVEALKAQKAQE